MVVATGLASSAVINQWTPAQMPNVTQWLDAANPASLPATSPVDSWNDLSGLGHHMTAAGAQRPTIVPAGLNGLPYINFDGTGQKLTCPAFVTNVTDFLISGVAYTASSGGQRCWFGTGMNSHIGCSHKTDTVNGGSGWYGFVMGGVRWVDNSWPPRLDAWLSQTISRVGGNTSNRANGVQQGGLVTNTPTVGSGNSFIAVDNWATLTMRCAEIVVVEGAWSLDDRDKLETYFRIKWGLPSS